MGSVGRCLRKQLGPGTGGESGQACSCSPGVRKRVDLEGLPEMPDLPELSWQARPSVGAGELGFREGSYHFLTNKSGSPCLRCLCKYGLC